MSVDVDLPAGRSYSAGATILRRVIAFCRGNDLAPGGAGPDVRQAYQAPAEKPHRRPALRSPRLARGTASSHGRSRANFPTGERRASSIAALAPRQSIRPLSLPDAIAEIL